MHIPRVPGGFDNLPKDSWARLGNVLYWLGIMVGAAPFLLMVSLVAWEFLWNGNFTPVEITPLLLSGAWAVFCYAIGWSLRYILSGATDHPLNIYLNSSEKFLEAVIQLGFCLWAIRMGTDGYNWFHSGQAMIWFHKTFG